MPLSAPNKNKHFRKNNHVKMLLLKNFMVDFEVMVLKLNFFKTLNMIIYT